MNVAIDLNSLFTQTFGSNNGVNKLINLEPKMTVTTTGVQTWGNEPIEAYQSGKQAWVSDDGELIQGIYVNMPDKEYHSIKGCISSSCLKKFAFNPQEGYSYYNGDCKTKEMSSKLQRAMNAGHLIHGHVLEPWITDYGVNKPLTIDELNGKGYKVLADHEALKAEMEQYELKGGNRKIEDKLKLLRTEIDDSYLYYPDYLDEVKAKSSRYLDKEDYDRAIKAAEVFSESHLYNRNYKRGGYSELTIIAYCEDTGMWLKARIDRVDDKNRMLDLKTIHTLSAYQMKHEIEDRLYSIQGAFYYRVARLAGFELQDLFAITFIEWDEYIRFVNAIITERSWEKSKVYEEEIFYDFVDWHRTAEQKNSLNYSGEVMLDLSFFKLSQRRRVNS